MLNLRCIIIYYAFSLIRKMKLVLFASHGFRHKEAVEVTITIPASTKNVVEKVSKEAMTARAHIEDFSVWQA